jgi:hypothetical protein
MTELVLYAFVAVVAVVARPVLIEERAAAAIERMVPCPKHNAPANRGVGGSPRDSNPQPPASGRSSSVELGDAQHTMCAEHHARAAAAIAHVAARDERPEDAAIRLIAACAHETRCRFIPQLGGGPAIGAWQLEVPRSQRAALEADDVAQARQALRAARTGWQAYGCGGECPEMAAELERYEARARWAWTAP